MDQTSPKYIFDKYSEQYSEKYMDQTLYEPCISRLRDVVNTEKPVILDIGCGPANLTKAVIRIFPESDITGIDCSKNMLAITRQNIPAGNFINLDCRSLDIITGTYDLILAGFLLPYLDKNDALELFQNVSRLLKENGTYFLSNIVNLENLQVSSVSNNDNEKLLTYFYSLDDILNFAYKSGLELLFHKKINNPEYSDQPWLDLITCFKKI